ncbi:hypothetical protein [Microaceticoccus formicicus]|uniref:hypothetical protein n=1 Tax=Microaceticoccus formicicus TaxID=3118105 RepID=UPI003CD035FC|nr:hypothetical protein VZL98_05090 [Peptoniphilaceae bacterium AMB_02]
MSKLNLKHEDVLKFSDGYFGGNQIWFSDRYGKKHHSRTGCGIVAAANSMVYLAFTRSEYRDLYPFESLDKKSFSEFILLLSRYIKPRIYGIPTTSIIIRGIKRYTKGHGVSISNHNLSKITDKRRIIEFIKTGLEMDTPVLNVNWNHKNKILHNHWIAITGINENLNQNNIVLSSWGEKYEINMNDYFFNTIYNGLLYFI